MGVNLKRKKLFKITGILPRRMISLSFGSVQKFQRIRRGTRTPHRYLEGKNIVLLVREDIYQNALFV